MNAGPPPLTAEAIAELRRQREQILEMLDPAVRAALEIEAKGNPDELRILLAHEINFVNIDGTPEMIAAAINRAAQELACDDEDDELDEVPEVPGIH
jgi:hypothetical protein